RGRKVLIRWFKKNLVVVGIGKRILYYLVVDMNELNLIEYKLGIYDFKNSFIPFKWSSESSQQIVHVLYEWGTLLVFINQKEKDSSITKKILKIKEMDTQTKLKLLIQNDLYDMALTL